MTVFFKQNSENSVLLGPVVYASSGDNVTPNTDGSLTTSVIQVQKGTAGWSNADNSGSAAQARGYYPWTASSTECDTVGSLSVDVTVANYMPYPLRATILTSTAFAEMFSSATSTTTLDGNLVSVGTDTTSIIGNLTSAQTDITNLHGDLTSSQADIAGVQGDLTSTQSDITIIDANMVSVGHFRIYT